MTHNCQTILQPCLRPVESCTVPMRPNKGAEKTENPWEGRIMAIITREPGIAQSRIGPLIKSSESTASKELARLLDIGKIELDEAKCHRGRKFYRVKEYLQ